MTLAQILYELPTDRLREIVHHRATTLRGLPRVRDRRELAQFLSGALSAHSSIVGAIDSTSLPEARALVAIVARGGEAPLPELRSEAGAGREGALSEAIDGLERRGLAFWIDRNGYRSVFVPKAVRERAPLPLPLKNLARAAIDRYESTTIKQIHLNLGLRTQGSQARSALADSIASALTDRQFMEQALARASHQANEVLQFVLERGGAVPVQELAARHDGRMRSQLMAWGWATQWAFGKPRNAVEELLSLGIFVVDGAAAWGQWTVVVPADVARAVIGRSLFGDIVPEPPQWAITPAEGGAIRRHGSLIRDVAYLMGFVGRSEASHANTGNMHLNAIKALARGLTLPDVRYAEFVYVLARDAQLIAPRGRKSLYEVTPQSKSWFRGSPDAQIRALYDAWRGRASWAEPFEDSLSTQRSRRDAEEVDALRESAISLLQEAAGQLAGGLVSLDSLALHAHYRWWTRFHFGLHAADSDDPRDAVVGSNLAVLRRICGESMFWMGLTEIAPVTGDLPAAACLSDLGRRLLLDGPASAGPMDSARKFVLQPNLEIYAPPDLPANLLHRLFRITESTAAGMLALTTESLRRAMDRGETAAGILRFLRENSQTPVAQNVAYLIEEVGKKHGHIHVGQAGLYLQVSDPMILKELKAQKGLKIHFREQLADTVALIAGDSVEAVLKQLRQAGYLPVAGAEPPSAGDREERWYAAAAPAVHFDAVRESEVDGRIDWQAVAAGESTPWVEEVRGAQSGPTCTALEAIRALLHRAVRENQCIEITYHAPGAASTVRVIEPDQLTGAIVGGYCRLRQDRRHFNLQFITAARETGETFEPRHQARGTAGWS